MSEAFQAIFQRIRYAWLPLQRWASPLAFALTLASGLCSNHTLRILCLSLAILLFFIVAADIARSLLEKDSTGVARKRRARGFALWTLQVALTAMVASIYAVTIFVGLQPFLGMMPLLGMPILTTGVFSLACLAAWRNVDQWFREADVYEEELEEAAARPHKLLIPPRY